MKFAIFLFNEDLMCAQHAFLYAKELNEKGITTKIVLEGRATSIPRRYKDSPAFEKIYELAKKNGWIDCVCKACSAATKSIEAVRQEGLRLCSDLNGHVSMEKYIRSGYQIITI